MAPTEPPGLDWAIRVADLRWRKAARREQLPPPGPWSTWLILAGRGFGKTRAGAEWLTREALRAPDRRLALVGPTAAAVAGVMVGGESGLLGVAPERLRPRWVKSAGRVEWPNGSVAQCFSGHEADGVRGYQFHAAWCDELAHWPRPADVWINLRLSLRLGERPQALVTTTPKPLPLLKALAAEGRKPFGRVAVTRGSTRDNAANLPAEFVDEVYARYGGTATGRQELDGELLERIEGALWTVERIEAARRELPGPARRVVVAVDPPAGDGTCGIVAAALGQDGRGYVLGDRSVGGLPPHGWARAVASAAAEFAADCVVAEVNNGGAMVRHVLEAVQAGLPIKEVHASHGKVVRAEPVAALYEAGRVSHAGVFGELEAQMAAMTLGGGFVGQERSPDRADALVWALTELMLGGRRAGVPRIRALDGPPAI